MNMPGRACRKCREAIRLQLGAGLSAGLRAAMDQHMANCTACRNYAAQLQAATQELRRLATKPIESTPHFRARWVSAVEAANQPGPLAQVLAAWREWSWNLLLENRRLVAALAPVWVVIFVLRFTAPEVGGTPRPTLACSPVAAFRALKLEERPMLAFDPQAQQPSAARMPTNSPRGDRTATEPMTFRDDTELNVQVPRLA